MTPLVTLLQQHEFSRGDLVHLLGITDPAESEMIRAAACSILDAECGTTVYYRGLIEFSNQCLNDCHYCGIRASNEHVQRYRLTMEQIIEAAQWCAQQGYGSVVLQSGERCDQSFIAFVEEAVRRIKQETVCEQLPQGVGITLCVGEQEQSAYERFYAAGAHRYLLRIETTNPDLFARIHPPHQTLTSRLRCLSTLRSVGFQVGTGVMIGLPGQTLEHLAADISFFAEQDIDMIGMGPYIAHHQTPMNDWTDPLQPPEARLALALRMIAVCRIVLRDINIAATTALQALTDNGRELGLLHGANVIMPQLTPTEVRRQYQLYEGKPCLDENAVQCRGCLKMRIESTGRTIGLNEWGDSVHARKRLFKKTGEQ